MAERTYVLIFLTDLDFYDLSTCLCTLVPSQNCLIKFLLLLCLLWTVQHNFLFEFVPAASTDGNESDLKHLDTFPISIIFESAGK